jgi:hypothetical protein
MWSADYSVDQAYDSAMSRHRPGLTLICELLLERVVIRRIRRIGCNKLEVMEVTHLRRSQITCRVPCVPETVQLRGSGNQDR